MSVAELLDEEAVRALMKRRKKADITAVGEGKTDRIFLEELVKLVEPGLVVAYMPATGKDFMADVIIGISLSLQAIVSKTEHRIKMIMRDCDDKRPGVILRSVLNSLRARGEKVDELWKEGHVLLAKWGIHHLIVLALGAYGDEALKAFGVKRYQMEDYALLCLVRRPELIGLKPSDIEGLRGETSKDVLEAIAERCGRRHEELLSYVLRKAREEGLLKIVLGGLYDELKRALEEARREAAR